MSKHKIKIICDNIDDLKIDISDEVLKRIINFSQVNPSYLEIGIDIDLLKEELKEAEVQCPPELMGKINYCLKKGLV